eukprot:157993-Prymnesium_polylepis.1
MPTGFNIFWTCLALSPLLCYGSWITIALFTSRATLADAAFLILSYYRDQAMLAVQLVQQVITLTFHFTWPEYLNLQAFVDFLSDPTQILMDNVAHIVNILYGLQEENIAELMSGAASLLI